MARLKNILVPDIRPWWSGRLLLLLGLMANIAYSDSHQDVELDAVVESFDESQFTKSEFCPEALVLVRVTVTNRTARSQELVLKGGWQSRVYFNITDQDGDIVWDSDIVNQLKDQLENEAALRKTGIGTIVADAHTRRVLHPGDSVFWVESWDQRDMNGQLVPPDRYLVTMNYRWADSGDDHLEISSSPIEIVISDKGCH